MLILPFFVNFGPAIAQDAPTAPAAALNYEPPQFRTVATVPPPVLPPDTALRLLVDADFAPYSFLSSSGAPAGLSVELALAACTELKIACTIIARSFSEILPSLQQGDGDVIVTGPRLDSALLRDTLMTRPYFRIMGRFAVKKDADLANPDAASLAGRRIGVAKGTLHARWLETYYGDAEIVAFDTAAKAAEALRAGEVDAAFGDDLAFVYWVAGDASQGCCRLLGGAFSDFDHFSRNLAFLVPKDRPDLRAALDYGLDMAQTNGATARIIKAYVPLNPW